MPPILYEGSTYACNTAGGWFARSAHVLRQVGDVLLDPASKQAAPLKRWLNAADAFDHSDKATSHAIYEVKHCFLTDVLRAGFAVHLEHVM